LFFDDRLLDGDELFMFPVDPARPTRSDSDAGTDSGYESWNHE
jgi:hypothetical protein